MMREWIPLFVLFCAVNADIIRLTSADFESRVNSMKTPVVVAFQHTNATGWRQSEYDFISADSAFKGKSVAFASFSLDKEEEQEFAEKYKVSFNKQTSPKMPFLRIFDASKGGVEKPEYFSGRNTATEIATWVSSVTGIKATKSEVVVVTPKNWKSVVMNPKKNVLVEFYAPWCGYCKRIAPVLEEVAHSVKGESSIVIAKYDAAANRDMDLEQFSVQGYPSLRFFVAGKQKTMAMYGGDREAKDFMKYFNEMLGTQRVVGGGLSVKVGRLPALEAIAKRFGKADAEGRSAAIAEAKTVVAGLDNKQDAKHGNALVKLMEEAAAKDGDAVTFLKQEGDRLKSSLAPLAASHAKAHYYRQRLNYVHALLGVKESDYPGEDIDESAVVVLDPTNFDAHVGAGKPAFVEFYAPWCGHCKKLIPEWAEAALTLAETHANVVFAKLDASAHSQFGEKFGVTGFPTLLWFEGTSQKNPEKYAGARDAAGLVKFVEGKLGKKTEL